MSREDVSLGGSVMLVWRSESPFDAKASRVMTHEGRDLRLIHRPIAHRFVDRMESEASLSARIEVVLGEESGPKERVCLRVKVLESEAGAKQQ